MFVVAALDSSETIQATLLLVAMKCDLKYSLAYFSASVV